MNPTTNTQDGAQPVGQYWLGANGNIYWNDTSPGGGVKDMGKPLGSNALSSSGFDAEKGSFMATQIADPNAPTGKSDWQIYNEQAAAAKATEEKKAAGLRSNITDLVAKAKDLLNLFGTKAESVYGTKKSEAESKYQKGLGELAQTYSTEMPKIGQAYAAQGAYRSTWRGGAEQAAQQGYQKQLSDLAEAQKGALSQLGGEYTKTKAETATQLGGLQTVLDRLSSETDVNALTALRNKVDQQIADLSVTTATTQTPAEQLGVTSGIQGMSDKFASANQTISTIINGQAPAILKRQIATQIVSNSDLTDQEKQNLLSRINTEIA